MLIKNPITAGVVANMQLLDKMLQARMLYYTKDHTIGEESPEAMAAIQEHNLARRVLHAIQEAHGFIEKRTEVQQRKWEDMEKERRKHQGGSALWTE